MSEFSYLSVLLSIIFGLAITHLLQGWRNLILYRARIVGYWPIQVWSAFLLLVCAQAWWVMFGLRNQHAWTFVGFIILLGHATAIYLAAGLIYPDFGARESIDLREHYFANHRYLFGMMAAVVLLSFVHVMWAGDIPLVSLNVGFLAFYFVAATFAAVTANESYHKFMAVFIAASFLVCIALLFARLR